MILITFKDGIMAADKRTFWGDQYEDGATKVFNTYSSEMVPVIIGGAGTVSKIKEAIHWWRAGACDHYPDSGNEASVWIYDGLRLLRYAGSHFPWEHSVDRPTADGRGYATGIALGAMLSEQSAAEANLLAQEYTVFCGGGVDSVSISHVKDYFTGEIPPNIQDPASKGCGECFAQNTHWKLNKWRSLCKKNNCQYAVQRDVLI